MKAYLDTEPKKHFAECSICGKRGTKDYILLHIDDLDKYLCENCITGMMYAIIVIKKIQEGVDPSEEDEGINLSSLISLN